MEKNNFIHTYREREETGRHRQMCIEEVSSIYTKLFRCLSLRGGCTGGYCFVI